MELVVDVAEADARLVGTNRRATSTVAHPFTGHLELAACLKRRCDEDQPDEQPTRRNP